MEDSSRMVSAMIQRPIILTDLDLFDEAKKMTFSYSLSYWDAAIVAATHRFKAPLLYSEDLSHGQHYGKVQVINPFAEL
jgi:predicted nucleic acid-binding protein